jgi:hypothetical protein
MHRYLQNKYKIFKMKNICWSLLCLVILSCNQVSEKSASTKNQILKLKNDTLIYDTVSFFKTTPDCKKDTCESFVEAKYPQFKDQNINDFIKIKLSALPYEGPNNNNLEVAADSFINEYLSLKTEYPNSAFAYEWIQSLTVAYQYIPIISFIHKMYIYTGGAHGMESVFYYNLNKKTLKLLTLEDILKSNYQDKLTEVGEIIFRKNEGLAETEPLTNYFFEDNKFTLNNNFLITPEGLLFIYNPYEIKAYAYGATELLIPYSSIKDLIKEDEILAQIINKNASI